MRKTCRGITVIALVAGAAACGDVNAALEKQSQARQLSADLLVQFTKAADAANRSVMADTDDVSVAYAKEAEQAKAAVQKNVEVLTPILQALNYADETRLLQEFTARFADYDKLDRSILELAVENTNLKAQRLSFGPAQDAADTFRDALEAVAASAPEKDAWHARSLAATAVAMLRDIQVQQAPHIAEADDAAMARIEKRMATSEAGARSALTTLASIAPSAAQAKIAAASAALDRFVAVNAQILALSHRNTNVRSLALSLSEKPALVAACENRLHALQDALTKRGYTGARWK